MTIPGLAILLFAAHVQAAVLWNEGINGDLSSNQAAPTPFTLASGVNSFIGSVSSSDSQDWLALTVPVGFQLTSFVLSSYVSSDPQGFTGVQSGTAFVGSPFSAGSYLGYAHYGTGATNNGPATNLLGVNLLPLMGDNVGVAPGSAGFATPLSSGSYVFLIQQLGSLTSYQFDYTTVAVPEPASWSLFIFFGGAIFALRLFSRPVGRPFSARSR